MRCDRCHEEMGSDWKTCWNMGCEVSPAYDATKALKLSLHNGSTSGNRATTPVNASSGRLRSNITFEAKTNSELLAAFDAEAPVYFLGRKSAPPHRGNSNIGTSVMSAS